MHSLNDVTVHALPENGKKVCPYFVRICGWSWMRASKNHSPARVVKEAFEIGGLSKAQADTLQREMIALITRVKENKL